MANKKKANKRSTVPSSKTSKKKSLQTKKTAKTATKKNLVAKKTVKKKATKKKAAKKRSPSEHLAPKQTEKRDVDSKLKQDVEIEAIEIPTLDDAIAWCDRVTGITEECELMTKNSDASVRDLMESIALNGQQRPISITPDGKILDGRHRLVACCALGFEPEFEQKTVESPLQHVLADTTQRDYNPAARASIALKTEDYIKKRFSELADDEKVGRMNRKRFTHDQSIDIGSEDPLYVKAGETIREVAIRLAGAKESTVQDFITLMKKDVELAEQAVQGEITLKQALRQTRPPRTHKNPPAQAEAKSVSGSDQHTSAPMPPVSGEQGTREDAVLPNGTAVMVREHRSVQITPGKSLSGEDGFGLFFCDSEFVWFEHVGEQGEANDRAQEFLDE